jgi:hypothetical protein
MIAAAPRVKVAIVICLCAVSPAVLASGDRGSRLGQNGRSAAAIPEAPSRATIHVQAS